MVSCHILVMCASAKSYDFHDYVFECIDIKLCFDIRGYILWPPRECDQ